MVVTGLLLLIAACVAQDMPVPGLQSAADLAAREGYTVETHEVTTADGYMLQLHRIPGRSPGAVPVLLIHSLFSSSEEWLVSGPRTALGYTLADEGYDVWLGNTRGYIHCRRHVSLSTSDSAFWQFSLHEQAVYDLPSMIDYILLLSGHSSLFYVGHSSGNTLLYMLAASRAEYNAKIRLQFSLSPAAFVSRIETVKEAAITAFVSPVQSLKQRVSSSSLISSTRQWVQRLTMLCKLGLWRWDVCARVLLPIVRKVGAPLDDVHLFSMGTVLHFVQMISSGALRRYDYGVLENLLHYKSALPPVYDLSHVTCGVVLVASVADVLAPLQDMKLLRQRLPNVRDVISVEDTGFTPRDFVTGVEARTLVYNKLIMIMRAELTSGDHFRASFQLKKNTFMSHEFEVLSPDLSTDPEEYPMKNEYYYQDTRHIHQDDTPLCQGGANCSTLRGNKRGASDSVRTEVISDKISNMAGGYTDTFKNYTSEILSSQNHTAHSASNHTNHSTDPNTFRNIATNSFYNFVTNKPTTINFLATERTNNNSSLHTIAGNPKPIANINIPDRNATGMYHISITDIPGNITKHNLSYVSHYKTSSEGPAKQMPSSSEVTHNKNQSKIFSEVSATNTSEFYDFRVTTNIAIKNGSLATFPTPHVPASFTGNGYNATTHMQEYSADSLIPSSSNSVVFPKLLTVVLVVLVVNIHKILLHQQ